ncbi:phosphoglycerate kinase [Patescibacteria group bacterium]|nr:phosphoglycerate kinase [Patescibacteria group bacterium]
MKLKSLDEIKKLKGKRVLVRVDFNVPLKKSGARIVVADNTKIRAALPTIKYLLGQGAKVILMSHLGDPGGKAKKNLSLKPIGAALGKLLLMKGTAPADWEGRKGLKKIDEMKTGEVMMLENLRFHVGEEKNDRKFAAGLASLADIYVNDAFAAAHRAHASIVGVPKFLPSYAGLLMKKEISVLGSLLAKPSKPFVALIGGAKISTKISVIENLLKKVNSLLLGGALVNNFFKAAGYEIGASVYEPKELKTAKKLLKNKKIVLPVDFVVGDFKGKKARVVSVPKKKIALCKKPYALLDIGPETIKKYASIVRKAQTIVWNGPMGMFEIPKYSHGTIALGRLIAARSRGKVFGVVGGGETIEAIEKTKMAEYIDHISTGGGAMLEFLEGKVLPGIKPLLK